MAFWCHGATGTGRFLLHQNRLDHQPDGFQQVRRAALTVAQGTRWSGPTQCHGLAGTIEFLLDVYQHTADDFYRQQAGEAARLLRAFAREHAEGILFVTDRDTANPGFSTGHAGVVAALLRYLHPKSSSHLLDLSPPLADTNPPRTP
jgi:lantibiotic modifying enzyme